ncbi:STAS domain-containing protein [Hamadaea tsunoensis]|uniref:STAS domain-containing protein n=1 Tax=Hamadaea tsunoensis TaxID=53368 RepID=UPI00040E85E1|nr:STAS domain-containing protein [Hamadaea tsunoensis]
MSTLTLSIASSPVLERTEVLLVIGEIDLTTASHLSTAIKDVVCRGGIQRLTIDLSQVTFLDCAGIRALIDGGNWAAVHDVALHVANPHGIVHRVLQMTGVLNELTGKATPLATSTNRPPAGIDHPPASDPHKLTVLTGGYANIRFAYADARLRCHLGRLVLADPADGAM